MFIWVGRKPDIKVEYHETEGCHTYVVVWMGEIVASGTATAHWEAVGLAIKDRSDIMQAILKGDLKCGR